MTLQYDIRDFGAIADSGTDNATAIQAAIDACARAGGGQVIVPAGGVFRSGSVVLKSHVELFLERGATLKASANWDDMTQRRGSSALSSGAIQAEYPESGIFLAAYDAVDVGISGPGTLDGSGPDYALEVTEHIYRMPRERPYLLFFIGCRNVCLTDTMFKDGALWTVRLSGCSEVEIRGIRIDNDMRVPNADGIDLDRCRNVRISDCDIRCPDDAICLKASDEFDEYGPCENITVSNCTLQTRSSALVLGVECTGDIRNVVFSNCVIVDSNRGLSLNLGQPGTFENILFTNIVIETRYFHESWWGSGEPIYVSTLPWRDATGSIRNVRFQHILARSENGIYVIGHEPAAISGVVFDDVRVELDKWGEFAGGRKDLRPWSGGDELVQQTTSGFYLEVVDDVQIRDCEIAWGPNAPGYFGEPLVTVGVRGLNLNGFRGGGAPRA